MSTWVSWDSLGVDLPVVGGHAGITILPLFSQVKYHLSTLHDLIIPAEVVGIHTLFHSKGRTCLFVPTSGPECFPPNFKLILAIF
jgi:hypothetical protein